MTQKDVEDIKFLTLILQELRRQVDSDVTCFNYELNSRFTEDEDGRIISDHPLRGLERDIQITWSPSESTNHPFKHVDRLVMRWWLASNDFHIDLRTSVPGQTRNNQMLTKRKSSLFAHYEDGYCNHAYELNNEDKKLVLKMKLDYVYIYKKVRAWEDEEIPRRKREHLVNTVCAAFPTILDSLMMEQFDEEKGT